jgi:accessory colonization factor AcfC
MQKAIAGEFCDFLQSDEARQIFVKWGWLAPLAP